MALSHIPMAADSNNPPDDSGIGTGANSTDPPAPAPGLTFLVTTNPREAKSAATRKRVRQAAALKSWRDIKGERAATGPAPKRSKVAECNRARRKASAAAAATAAVQPITWEGVPPLSVLPAAHPHVHHNDNHNHSHAHQVHHQLVPDHIHDDDLQLQHPGTVLLPARPADLAAASASASASSSSSSSTRTLSSLSSLSSVPSPSPFVHPQDHDLRHDTRLDIYGLPAASPRCQPVSTPPYRSHTLTATLLPRSPESSLATTPVVTTQSTICDNDGILRASFRHTIGWPTDHTGKIFTSPKLPSVDDIVRHQEACHSRRGSASSSLRVWDPSFPTRSPPSPCLVYCNELDPFNCCPVKHKSWFDGVLHHMLTVFAPRAWPALKITNEQGLKWEHFMTQHAFSEPALYYVRLLFATGDMIALNVARPQLRLWLQARAIESINDALADPSRATSDALILAIGRIALNESLYGDKVAAHTLHRPAQQRMIALRGGIDALDFPPLVKRLMRWSDKVMSMQGGTPRMIPDDTAPHYTDATSVEVLEKWSPREAMALRKKSQMQAARSQK